MNNGFANFLDRIKDDDYPETFELDDISTLEKLEYKLKKAEEVLVSKMAKKKKDVWIMKLGLFVIMILIISDITIQMIHSSNDSFPDGPTFLLNIALIVTAVFLILLFVFTMVEEVIYQITDWKRRRNTTDKVSLEDGDEKNETKVTRMDCDNLKDRCQKLVEDLNENYEPMRNRYKRVYNHYVFYSFVVFFLFQILGVSSLLDKLFYSTNQNLRKMVSDIAIYFFTVILLGVFWGSSIMNGISEYKKFQF